jgi:hypothetical protein
VPALGSSFVPRRYSFVSRTVESPKNCGGKSHTHCQFTEFIQPACTLTTTPRFNEPAHPHLLSPHYIGAAAAFAANHAANACAFLVCINTVPGPVNLHTSPSPDAIFDRIPPDATRSRTYLQFQATRCPLSMMYFSSFWSYATCQHTCLRHREDSHRRNQTLTSFLIIAPKLVHQRIPCPLILYTNRPSPENMALPSPWLLYSVTMPFVHARNASLPTLHCSWPPSWMMVMSPMAAGARRSSPGPL